MKYLTVFEKKSQYKLKCVLDENCGFMETTDIFLRSAEETSNKNHKILCPIVWLSSH